MSTWERAGVSCFFFFGAPGPASVAPGVAPGGRAIERASARARSARGEVPNPIDRASPGLELLAWLGDPEGGDPEVTESKRGKVCIKSKLWASEAPDARPPFPPQPQFPDPGPRALGARKSQAGGHRAPDPESYNRLPVLTDLARD